MNIRAAAVNELLKTEQEQQFANLRAAALSNEYKGRDGALLVRLYLGTLERKISLDFALNTFLSKGIKSLPTGMQWILRLGLYQLYFMEKIPRHAAVNESVNLAKERFGPGMAKLTNAVLRNAGKTDFDTLLDKLPDGSPKRLSTAASAPEELCAHWIMDFGYERAEKILSHSLGQKQATLRLNPLKGNMAEIRKELETHGPVEDTPLPDMVTYLGDDLGSLPLLKDGRVYAQGIHAALISHLLAPEKGESVLDLCAAPGGKSCHMAALMANEGRIVACDLHENRVRKLRDNAKTLGAAIVEGRVNDASQEKPDFVNAFDRVLCDVPCSNSGIFAKRPDAKYKWNLQDVRSLSKLQRDILYTAAACVKSGGMLMYSTCSVDFLENEKVAQAFTKDHSDFEPVDLMERLPEGFQPVGDGPMLRFEPSDAGEGFFCALWRKK